MSTLLNVFRHAARSVAMRVICNELLDRIRTSSEMFTIVSGVCTKSVYVSAQPSFFFIFETVRRFAMKCGVVVLNQKL